MGVHIFKTGLHKRMYLTHQFLRYLNWTLVFTQKINGEWSYCIVLTLASKAEFLRLLWVFVDDDFVSFRGKIYLNQIYEFNPYTCFTGIASLCCPVGRVEGHGAKEGGCVEQQRPCLLQLLKKNWLKIEVELKLRQAHSGDDEGYKAKV